MRVTLAVLLFASLALAAPSHRDEDAVAQALVEPVAPVPPVAPVEAVAPVPPFAANSRRPPFGFPPPPDAGHQRPPPPPVGPRPPVPPPPPPVRGRPPFGRERRPGPPRRGEDDDFPRRRPHRHHHEHEHDEHEHRHRKGKHHHRHSHAHSFASTARHAFFAFTDNAIFDIAWALTKLAIMSLVGFKVARMWRERREGQVRLEEGDAEGAMRGKLPTPVTQEKV